MNRKNIAFCIFVAVLLSACNRKDAQVFKEMIPLRNALVQKYKVADIRLATWNGNNLTISFINSSFNDLTDPEKQSKAAEIARFINTHYVSIMYIQSIFISFVIYKNYVLFDYTNSLHSYFFNTSNL